MLDVEDARELQAAVLALKAMDRTLVRDINRDTRSVLNGPWQQEVKSRARTTMDSRVLATGARIKAGNPPVAVAASSTRAIGKTRRLKPAERWQGWEFGSDRNAYSRYTGTSPKGKKYPVARRTTRHLPPRTRQGRVVYPAFAAIAPRAVELWLQTIVRKTYDAFEGK